MTVESQVQPERFVEDSRRALTNPLLQRALSIATVKATSARYEAVTHVGAANWEQLRERCRTRQVPQDVRSRGET